MPATNRNDGVNQLRDDLQRQERRIRELERQLADATKGKMPEMQTLDPDMIWVESMVSQQSGDGMVVIRWFTHLAHVELAAARQLALQILEAADAANSDAFLMGFFEDRLKADSDMQGAMLACFREYREKKAGAA